MALSRQVSRLYLFGNPQIANCPLSLAHSLRSIEWWCPRSTYKQKNGSLDNTRSRRIVAEMNISIIRVKWFSIPIDWLNLDSASNLYRRCHHHRVYLEEVAAGVVGANSN